MTDPGRVAFGPEIFRIQRHGGVSRYVIEVHQGLLARGIDSTIVAGLHRSAMLADVPQVRGVDVDSFQPEGLRQAVTRFADQRWAQRGRRRLGPGDVWHPSYFPVVPRGTSKLAITVYDMVHERYPEEMGPRDRTLALKAPACRAADVVFCISASTAEDVQERLGIPVDRIAVTHLGVRPVAPREQPAPFGDRPYVVYVGDRRPLYKGWTMLLDALRGVPGDLGLVCVGAPVSRDELVAVAERGLEGRVRFEGGDDEALAGRLRDSEGLVYPSRYEGFGLPPLEALAQGCPVLATRVGAVPEVVGGIALMVEPTVDEIGGGIERLLAAGPDVERQRREGPAYAARFPWQATADATLDGYRRTLG